jgi:hypothetical protein
MNVNALSISSQPPPTVVPPPQNVAPPVILSGISLDTLLRDTGRTKNNTPGDGYNNCGFNGVLEHLADEPSNSEIVNRLRSLLGYPNENSGTMFDSNSCLDVANLLGRAVAVTDYDSSNNLTKISLSLPNIGIFPFHGTTPLCQNFVEMLNSAKWSPIVDSLSQWFAANLPDTFNFREATMHDVFLGLLRHPRTIALAYRDGSNHFDAAPHINRPREGNVRKFLIEAEAGLQREIDRRREAKDSVGTEEEDGGTEEEDSNETTD